MYGRFASGESGHGIAMKIIMSARENQMVIVRNFLVAVSCRLATDEPMVINTMAIVINTICINPKNRKSNCRMAS